MGFTLVELLIAVTILVLLSTMLFLILDAATRLWRENERRVDSYREARAALNLMTRELRSTVRLDPVIRDSFFINATPQQLSLSSTPDWIKPPSTNDNIFFLSAEPKSMQSNGEDKSDLCAVGYFLAWSNDGERGYRIYRHFKSSDSTFAQLLAAASPSLFSGVLAANNTENEVLARNIMSLSIKGYEQTGTTLTYQANWPKNQKPAMVEIQMVAINTESAVQLGGIESKWKTPDPDFMLRNSQTFSVRVKSPAIPQPLPTPTP